MRWAFLNTGELDKFSKWDLFCCLLSSLHKDSCNQKLVKLIAILSTFFATVWQRVCLGSKVKRRKLNCRDIFLILRNIARVIIHLVIEIYEEWRQAMEKAARVTFSYILVPKWQAESHLHDRIGADSVVC